MKELLFDAKFIVRWKGGTQNTCHRKHSVQGKGHDRVQKHLQDHRPLGGDLLYLVMSHDPLPTHKISLRPTCRKLRTLGMELPIKSILYLCTILVYEGLVKKGILKPVQINE